MAKPITKVFEDADAVPPRAARRPGSPAGGLRAAVLGATLALVPGLAKAAQTIVGTWAPDPRECAPMDALHIGPLDMMMGDEFGCSFSDVARSGEVVTWHGSCGMPERRRDRSTVVAERRGQLLYVWLNGAQNGPYLRCQTGPR